MTIDLITPLVKQGQEAFDKCQYHDLLRAVYDLAAIAEEETLRAEEFFQERLKQVQATDKAYVNTIKTVAKICEETTDEATQST